MIGQRVLGKCGKLGETEEYWVKPLCQYSWCSFAFRGEDAAPFLQVKEREGTSYLRVLWPVSGVQSDLPDSAFFFSNSFSLKYSVCQGVILRLQVLNPIISTEMLKVSFLCLSILGNIYCLLFTPYFPSLLSPHLDSLPPWFFFIFVTE